MKKFLFILLSLSLFSAPAWGSGLNNDTKLYMSFDEATNGATTVDSALEVLDYGSGGNVITQYGNATYQTATTQVWNASIQVDGSGDWLKANGVLTDLANDTSGTVAFWLNLDATTSDDTYLFGLSRRANAVRTELSIYVNSRTDKDNMYIRVWKDDAIQWTWQSNTNWLDAYYGTQLHIMISQNGTSPTIYANGTDVTSSGGSLTGSNQGAWMKTFITDATNKADSFCIGALSYNSSEAFLAKGFYSDFRIWSTAKDSSDATTLYGGGSGTTASIDNDEVFWIQDVQDLSSEGGNTPHIPDYIGTAQLDTGVTKYAGDTSSLSLDGNSDDVTLPDSADWDVIGDSTDNWTLDGWVKLDTYSTTMTFLSQGTGLVFWDFSHKNGQGIQFYAYNSSEILNTGKGGVISDTDWHHVALCKVGDEYGCYLDGTQVNYTQDSSTHTYSSDLRVGAFDGSQYLDGHMAHWRVQNSNIFSASPNSGKTDTITAPTAPYTYEAGGGGSTGSQVIIIS